MTTVLIIFGLLFLLAAIRIFFAVKKRDKVLLLPHSTQTSEEPVYFDVNKMITIKQMKADFKSYNRKLKKERRIEKTNSELYY